jgi:integrase
MPPLQTLSDVITLYLEHRAKAGFAANTVKNDRKALTHLLAIVGNIQVRAITPRHMDTWLAERGRTCGPSSLNTEMGSLKAFFAYCRARKFLPPHEDPLAGRRWFKVQARTKLFIPVTDFARVLDCADHPVDRIVIASGLYLLGRGPSEIARIRVRDIDLDRREVELYRQKTNDRDRLPINPDYDRELRRWLEEYPSLVPNWSRDWYLHPSKIAPPYNQQLRHFSYTRSSWTIRPNRPIARIYDTIKRVLQAAGYDDTDVHQEGGHTLRRSGALAYYNALLAAGVPDALRKVQSMLGHSSITTTEIYLDIRQDRVERNKVVQDLSLAPILDNVVPLRPAAAEGS